MCPSSQRLHGAAHKLVFDDEQAKVFADSENAKIIADAIRALSDYPMRREAMGRRGREWVLANATRETLAQRYLDIMQDLVNA